MKRNITKMLEKWNKEEKEPLFLYGIFGVGKTYICKSFAKNNFDSYFYFKLPREILLKSCTEDFDLNDFFIKNFECDINIIKNNFVIFDDTDKRTDIYKKILDFGIVNHCKWIFVSEYNWIKEEYKIGDIFVLKMFPLQFDEFLVASGNEWYAEIIKTHSVMQKKIPDMVHKELISDFCEYMWVGGMPDVLNEYFLLKNEINISRKQESIKQLVFFEKERKDSFYKTNQIIDAVDFNLLNQTKKFMVKTLGNNASITNFSDILDELVLKEKLLREEESADSSKFKFFYPEFSFILTNKYDEITDVEYKAREENYIFRTLMENEIKTVFWDSGNNARLNFLINLGYDKIIVDYRSDNKSNSKSIESFQKRFGYKKILKISDSNFVDNDKVKTIPIYALFAFDNLKIKQMF